MCRVYAVESQRERVTQRGRGQWPWHDRVKQRSTCARLSFYLVRASPSTFSGRLQTQRGWGRSSPCMTRKAARRNAPTRDGSGRSMMLHTMLIAAHAACGVAAFAAGCLVVRPPHRGVPATFSFYVGTLWLMVLFLLLVVALDWSALVTVVRLLYGALSVLA